MFLGANSAATRPSKSLVLALAIGGAVFGIALALGFGLFVLDACQGDQSCRRPVLALLGGVGVMQTLNIIAIAALIDHLNRKSERRLLKALRRKEPAG